MSEPTEEQKKEFLEWCGFKLVPKYGGADMNETLWKYPDDNHFETLPVIDLNFLFRWAVPAYLEAVQLEHPTWDEKGVVHHLFRAWLRVYWQGKGKYSFETALFWAIWEVIKHE